MTTPPHASPAPDLSADPSADPGADPGPLVVDLDGSLVACDTFWDGLTAALKEKPLLAFRTLAWLPHGRARVKQGLAQHAPTDAAKLPYRDQVLELIRSAKAQGRPVWLATGADAAVAHAVAKHLPLFDRVIASDAKTNRTGSRKLTAIRAALEEENRPPAFDYVGDAHVDQDLWEQSATPYAVAPRKAVAQRFAQFPTGVTLGQAHNRSLAAAFFVAARPQQWSKNLLLLVPMLVGQHLDAWRLGYIAIAIACFCLAASGVYLANDLFDMAADRKHPTKKKRPLASGALPPPAAVLGAPALLLTALLLAALTLPGAFLAALGVYVATTTAYTVSIKGRLVLDAVWLAALYTLRVIAGGMAVLVVPSAWLLVLSMFGFLSLALTKRCLELGLLEKQGATEAHGRGYQVRDKPVVLALGAAAGYAAILVFALYVNSKASSALYQTPELLWLICPLMAFWFSRLWVLANRAQISDDPLQFAATDRMTWLVLALAAGVVLAAQHVPFALPDDPRLAVPPDLVIPGAE
ncbi:MAG: UbiA family prenyltransferase [Planctomycetota bacterium]